MNANNPIMPQDHGWENGAVVRFYKTTMINEFKTYKCKDVNPTCSPIFDEVEMVEISFPGDTKTVLVRRVTENDRRFYPETYANFKEGRGMQGMPLQSWDKCSPTDVAMFHYHKIFTVEQLAGVNDGNIGALGPTGHKLREMAQAYVKAQDVSARNAQLSEHIKVADQRAADAEARQKSLEEQLAMLTKLLAQNGTIPAQSLPAPAEDDELEELRKKDVSALTQEDMQKLQSAPKPSKPRQLPPHMQPQA